MSSALKLEATVNSSALHIVQTKHRVAIPDDAHLFAVRQVCTAASRTTAQTPLKQMSTRHCRLTKVLSP